MKKNVAIFPSGTEIGLEINNALKYVKDINVIGLSSMKDHTRFVYDKYREDAPFYTEENCIDKLNEIIEEEKIEYIYPAHDDVLLFLTQNIACIKAKIITSDIKTVEIARSKKKTYEYLQEEDFIPQIYDIEEVTKYPVFIKPDIGQGAKGAKIVNNKMELKYEYNKNRDIVVCEYLIGTEYTVDCFTDMTGKLKVISPRKRNRIKCGISVNSNNIELTEEIKNIANRINNKLKFNGAWFFQLKEDINGKLKLLEIAARIPGTMGVSRNKGVNFPLLTLYNTMGIQTDIIENSYSVELDRAFINRYKIDIEYDTVYIDFDDTIIVNNKVNIYIIMYLYQLVNENKKIILLTKHKNIIKETLDKYKISINIFDEIIHINKAEEKRNYIKYRKAIFIDDSFSERKKIHDFLGIPVFDLDEIESLIDWRVKNYNE